MKLTVIPEPAEGSRTVFIRTTEGSTFFESTEKPDLYMDCGSCGSTLVHGFPVSRVQNVVFKCNNCGAYNDTLA